LLYRAAVHEERKAPTSTCARRERKAPLVSARGRRLLAAGAYASVMEGAGPCVSGRASGNAGVAAFVAGLAQEEGRAGQLWPSRGKGGATPIWAYGRQGGWRAGWAGGPRTKEEGEK
jgi:hypothetical protein